MTADAKNTREHWEERYASDTVRWNTDFRLDIYRWASEHLPRQRARILDVGSGPGHGLRHLCESHPDWEPQGVDFSQVAASQAVIPTMQVDILSGELVGEYDYVMCIQTLEHFRNPEIVIRKLLWAARRQVIITVPYREDISQHYEHESSFDKRFFRQFGSPWFEKRGYRLKVVIPKSQAERWALFSWRLRRLPRRGARQLRRLVRRVLVR